MTHKKTTAFVKLIYLFIDFLFTYLFVYFFIGSNMPEIVPRLNMALKGTHY